MKRLLQWLGGGLIALLVLLLGLAACAQHPSAAQTAGGLSPMDMEERIAERERLRTVDRMWLLPQTVSLPAQQPRLTPAEAAAAVAAGMLPPQRPITGGNAVGVISGGGATIVVPGHFPGGVSVIRGR